MCCTENEYNKNLLLIDCRDSILRNFSQTADTAFIVYDNRQFQNDLKETSKFLKKWLDLKEVVLSGSGKLAIGLLGFLEIPP